MVRDLFDKRSAKQKLYQWLRDKKHALSHEIIDWGRNNYCNHALRRLRELKAEGKVRKMPTSKKISYYGITRESAYEIIQWPESVI